MASDKTTNQQINVAAGGSITGSTITIGDIAGRDVIEDNLLLVSRTASADAVPVDVPDPARVARLIELRKLLVERCSEDDLRTLCFDLGLDYNDLGGEGKAGKARELISYLDHRRRLGDLARAGKESRPELSWDQIIPPEPG